jgi:hypothetical protein
MSIQTFPESARLKIDLMFEGLRYSEALGAAAAHAFPNFYPYRFQPGEPNPTGQPKVTIPYLFTLEDGPLVRVKGSGSSPWQAMGSRESGYRVASDQDPERALPIAFEPLPEWMKAKTSDGFPMAQAGLSLHGDMAVVNISPGCEYFLQRGEDGDSLRCTFCAYGAPNERVKHYGQLTGQVSLPDLTYQRLQETLTAALAEGGIRHIYLVGGSMTDWRQEGERYLEMGRALKRINTAGIPVSCGSGALPPDIQQQLFDEGLFDNVCFNLEIWSESLFRQVCPGKQKNVGYQRWIEALEHAVGLWGRNHVYSAMVAGIELEPEFEMGWEAAADLAIQGAEQLCSRGVIPIYSLYWPTGGKDHADYFSRLRNYFEKLNSEYRRIRQTHGLKIDDSFMCHRCAYMQLECDLDRAGLDGGSADG